MSNRLPVRRSQARTSRTGGLMPLSSLSGMSGAAYAAWCTRGGHAPAPRSWYARTAPWICSLRSGEQRARRPDGISSLALTALNPGLIKRRHGSYRRRWVMSTTTRISAVSGRLLMSSWPGQTGRPKSHQARGVSARSALSRAVSFTDPFTNAVLDRRFYIPDRDHCDQRVAGHLRKYRGLDSGLRVRPTYIPRPPVCSCSFLVLLVAAIPLAVAAVSGPARRPRSASAPSCGDHQPI